MVIKSFSHSFESMMASYVESLVGRSKLTKKMICDEALKTAEALKIVGLKPNLYRWYRTYVRKMNLKWDVATKTLVEGEKSNNENVVLPDQEDENSEVVIFDKCDVMETDDCKVREHFTSENDDSSIFLPSFEENIQIKEEPDMFDEHDYSQHRQQIVKTYNEPNIEVIKLKKQVQSLNRTVKFLEKKLNIVERQNHLLIKKMNERLSKLEDKVQ